MLTFEVFLRAEACVREPLNSSHNKQPSPHISTDLYTHTHKYPTKDTQTA